MHEISPRRVGGATLPSSSRPRAASRFETRVVYIPRGMTRADARQLLADHAEYGHWEMKRVVMFRDGARKVWLRRRVMKVRRTDAA